MDKDRPENVFDLTQFILFADSQNKTTGINLLQDIRQRVGKMASDTQLLNDSLYENFADMT